MYKLSDHSNLDKQDKALLNLTSRYGVFDHSILTHKQCKASKTSVKSSYKNRYRNSCFSKSRDMALDDIWKSFTVPIKFKVPPKN